jgi:hypothetical protein
LFAALPTLARLDRVEGQLSLVLVDVDEAAVATRDAARAIEAAAGAVTLLVSYLLIRTALSDLAGGPR